MVAGEAAIAIAGFDCRIDEDGISHAWRMIAVWNTKGMRHVQRRIGSLPDGLRWLSIPRDPLYGDLQALGEPSLARQAADIARELSVHHATTLLVGDAGCDAELLRGLTRHGIDVRTVAGYEHGTTCGAFEPAREFPGDAGREIAAIQHITGGGS